MVVNDNARELDKHGAFESIASKLAPTIPRECVKKLLYPQGLTTCAGADGICGSLQVNR
jgi:hypothetical protein